MFMVSCYFVVNMIDYEKFGTIGILKRTLNYFTQSLWISTLFTTKIGIYSVHLHLLVQRDCMSNQHLLQKIRSASVPS